MREAAINQGIGISEISGLTKVKFANSMVLTASPPGLAGFLHQNTPLTSLTTSRSTDGPDKNHRLDWPLPK
jgi:hypothetical protein